MAKQTTGRVLIPKNPVELLDLGAMIFKKHQADGGGSELASLVDNDWDRTGPTIQEAKDIHARAEALKGQMEEAYRQRDAMIAPIADIVRSSSKYLKGKYSKNPKRLADWGFKIDDTPPAKKAKKG